MKGVVALLIYIAISVCILAFASVGYDQASGWVILAGGTTGSFKLFTEAASDIFHNDLELGEQFSMESLLVSATALLLWIVGGFLLFAAVTRKRRVRFILSLVAIWIFASIFNLFWFLIRSI